MSAPRSNSNTTSTPIIVAHNLSKWYGEVIGLNHFNLTVEPGITGIVGPNGAGKSTLFKLVCGMIKPNVGTVTVMGEHPWRNDRLLGSIGLCPDFDNLADDMTGRRFLRLVGGLHAKTGAPLQERIKEVGAIVGLSDALDRAIAGYSRGMRQRLKIAGAILPDPQLLLLDEPLSGTDPLARRQLIELIQQLHFDRGHDIVVSSHVLFEVERLTSTVALIYKGRAVASGELSEIRALLDRHPHRIVIEADRDALLALAQRLIVRDEVVAVRFNTSAGAATDRSDETHAQGAVSATERSPNKGITVEVVRPDIFFDALPRIVTELDCAITQLYSRDESLEAVFKYIVGW